MVEINVETGNGKGQDLPGDKMTKISGKLGGQIFVIEEGTFKVDMLKQPLKFRSYRAVKVSKAEIHTAEGGARGLRLNGDIILTGKNTKFAGEGGFSQKEGENQNNKMLLIALDEKSAKKESEEFNVIQRENVAGMIKTLQKVSDNLSEIIAADRGENN